MFFSSNEYRKKPVGTKAIIAVFLAFSMFFISSCSFSSSDIMSPPALLGSQQQIKNALDELLPTGYSLVYSVAGEHTSAVRSIDLTDDGKDEIVAFFRTPAKKDVLNVAVLSETQTGWLLASSFAIDGADFHITEFVDFNDDGKPELLAGFKSNEMTQYTFTVYSFETSIRALVSGQYTHLIVSDITADGSPDVFYISHDTSSMSATGNLISRTEQQTAQLVSSLKIDGNIVRFTSLFAGIASVNKPAVFCGTLKGSNGGTTEMILWNGSSLINPFFDEDKGYAVTTHNQFYILPLDFDSDGITDIPTVKRFSGDAETALSDTVWLVEWNSYNGEKGLLKKSSVLYNSAMEYTLAYPLGKNTTESAFAESFDVYSSDGGKIWRISPKGEYDTVLYELFYGTKEQSMEQNTLYTDCVSAPDGVNSLWIHLNEKALTYYRSVAVTADDLCDMIAFGSLREN